MKTLTLLEQPDLEFIDRHLSYYLQGDKNFFQRKDKDMPNYFHSFNDGTFIKAAKIIESATKEDYEDIKSHVCKRLDGLRKDLLESQKKTERLINEIGDTKDVLKLIADSKDFNSAIYAILDTR
jgi:hypothetical protein